MEAGFPRSCDIFCSVVDNYGDIGVSWRLARQLAHEHGVAVRLWVDDLASFARLCPEADTALARQICRGVEVLHWATGRAPVAVADLVIEAFACKLPQAYLEAMAARARKPVWINLEYLSAEDWVEGCHRLPSPHPALPLTKYFFFPGFTAKTGGLLLERDLLARRDAFQAKIIQEDSRTPALSRGEREFWRNLGVPQRIEGELRVSLFSYENEALAALLAAWEHGAQPLTCLVPEGRALPQVRQYFGEAGELDFSPTAAVGLKSDPRYARGNLRVHVLPFVEQEQYDLLLWACDINFVRGEDSCVRAQWAGKPFVWQIYPQHDGVHLAKLEALRVRYTRGLAPGTEAAVRDLWLAWNGGADIGAAWQRFVARRAELSSHGLHWAQRLAANNLALNLLDFSREVA
ncbi:elongation factor P maturation arginine rhamnosyltransferase EarP [Ferrigenium sp. UT5]|uniref:elongation factor P maturation arginine rhamnosyltransferase EarP n=1 Tax=Ferrigenium sp. UT5 TaxID=3242105 RepID=UPI00354EEC97